MSNQRTQVFLHAWTGDPEKGMEFVKARYPAALVVPLAHLALRESGWRGQLRTLTRLRGRAIVFYFSTLNDVREPEIFIALHLLHGCRESVLADEAGNIRIIRFGDCLRRLPALVISAIADAAAFSITLMLFKRLRKQVASEPLRNTPGSPEIAYLYPYPLTRYFQGGAASHMCGFLQGLAENDDNCLIYSGCKFPFKLPFPILEIPARRKRFIFHESLTLTYNWSFAREVRKLLRGRRPGVIYQRHGRFVIAGVLLARALRVPLVLEYNGSEVWMAGHWDPARFHSWLLLAEEISIFGATTIVAVSDALKQELLQRGVPQERILVNSNGVDPAKFRPGCSNREEMRKRLGFEPDHVVGAFAGTFGYWHGVEVLQKAITKLLGDYPPESTGKLRFLLIGKGLLFESVHNALREYEERGLVVFPGIVPHEEMPSFLDIADILISPHVPMPDGRPFIGSPTKLLEYMAMGKAIVASRLDQIEALLEHNRTALLVSPGDVDELASAILAAEANPELRVRLGRNVREVTLEQHTWKRNAADVTRAVGLPRTPANKHAAPVLERAH